MADFRIQPLFEHLAQAFAFERIAQTGIEWVDVGREPAFTPKVIVGILEGREHVLRVQSQPSRHIGEKTAAQLGVRLAGLGFVGV